MESTIARKAVQYQMNGSVDAAAMAFFGTNMSGAEYTRHRGYQFLEQRDNPPKSHIAKNPEEYYVFDWSALRRELGNNKELGDKVNCTEIARRIDIRTIDGKLCHQFNAGQVKPPSLQLDVLESIQCSL